MVSGYSGVILEGKDNTVLLQLRDNKQNIDYPNLWGLFGGSIEENESPIEAAIREINEELGITLKKENLKLLLVAQDKGKNCYVFRTSFNQDLSKINLNEGQDMKYFSREEILKLDNLIPLIKKYESVYWGIRLKEK